MKFPMTSELLMNKLKKVYMAGVTLEVVTLFEVVLMLAQQNQML
jgi:hypothetical protein